MGNNFHFQGNLEKTFLSDMFAIIFRHRVSGRMEIAREDTVKEIFIDGGSVVHATSTDRADRLGAHLYRTGKLSREQLKETMKERDTTDRLHGQILIEKELLSPAELFEAIRGQMEAIVWSVFSWQKGDVSFTIGHLPDPSKVKIHLPMRQVIVRGIKQVADTKALVARLGKKSTVFETDYDTEDLIQLALDHDEYTLLRLINGQQTFFEICNMGPFGASENARLIYAFRLLGLIRTADDSTPRTGGVMIRMDTERADD